MQVLKRLADITDRREREQLERGIDLGLEAAPSVKDRTISTFSRGQQPHFAGINTFLKAPYVRGHPRRAASTTSRSSARRSTAAPPTAPGAGSGRRGSAGSPRCTAPTTSRWASTCARRSPSATRATSSRSRPTSRRRSTRSTRPSRTSTSRARSRSCSAATTRSAIPTCAASRRTSRASLGIIHFDRHVDTQETDLDERMHTTPWFHATEHPERAAEQPRADRHRRLAGAAARA